MAKWLNQIQDLPEDKQEILFAVKDKVKFGSFRKMKNGKDKFIDFCAAKKVYLTVDGWQPLPAPPKVKKAVIAKPVKEKTVKIKIKKSKVK